MHGSELWNAIAKIKDFGEDIGRTDVCWLEDPSKPVLVPLVKILGEHSSYKRYALTKKPKLEFISNE